MLLSDIVNACPATILDDGLSRLQSADDDAAQWPAYLGEWTCTRKKLAMALVKSSDNSNTDSRST